MNINATLIGQSVAFIFFIWFCMKYVWPPVLKILEERKKRIADGLEFSDQAQKKLEEAKEHSEQYVHEAKQKAHLIVSKANEHAVTIVNDAKIKAQEEAERLKASAKDEIQREKIKVEEELRKKIASFAVMGAAKVIEAHVDEKEHARLLEKFTAEL